MKMLLCMILSALFLAGCAPAAPEAPAEKDRLPVISSFSGTMTQTTDIGNEYVSRFSTETRITLSDDSVQVAGNQEAVFLSRDIIYYEDRDAYESGNPYGEAEAWERHTPQDAEGHTVVNITQPGAYRISGILSAGQIRVDLGEEARNNPDAVVELVLEGADITCTVAPAILFLNVYECDANWSKKTASADVDTSAAGACLVLQGENRVTGSHVARIYKDKPGEKKLWKQDGAIYSYQSLNVYGPGALELTADNEGLDTELHLTIHGGNITIRSGNDGINTNEDGVSVTTILGGNLHIIAGLGAEGDGIDSNGYLVIRGGTVVSAAHPASDAGLDSDLGSFIHGGTVIALGSAMDWAESNSQQVTINLQFASQRPGSSAIVICRPDGQVVFAYDPGEDPILGTNARVYSGAVISCPDLKVGDSYFVYQDGKLQGIAAQGIYSQVTGYEEGIRMQYSGTDVVRGGGNPPEGFGGGNPPDGFEGGNPPDGFEGGNPPDGFGGGNPPDGFEGGNPPDGFGAGRPPEDSGGRRWQGEQAGTGSTLFYMQDKVNFFSGVSEAE